MNSITKYKDNIEDVVNKLNNNINYFNNFGDAYIPLTLRNHLEEIVLEFNKVKDLVEEIEEDSVNLDTSV
jgi:predicted nucleotidyltransferase